MRSLQQIQLMPLIVNTIFVNGRSISISVPSFKEIVLIFCKIEATVCTLYILWISNIFPLVFEPEFSKIHANVNTGYFAEYQYDFDIIWRQCIINVIVYIEAKKKWWHHLDMCMDEG